MTVAFFDTQTDESRLKTEIVEAFFVSWARVLSGHQKRDGRVPALAYVDLFAGPGRYVDSSESTPIRIVKRVLERDEWRTNTLLFFNEQTPELLDKLKANVAEAVAQSGKTLGIPPIFTSDRVDTGYDACLKPVADRPTLFFVDPWGYIGINLRMLRKLVAGFGNDLIFFFNYRRINAAVSNELFEQRMDELFGSRSESLRAEVANLHGHERELAIVKAASEEISENVGKFVQRFRFGDVEATHYLFFVSKHDKGHSIMTDIMAKRSSVDQFGIPTFGSKKAAQTSLFATDPVEALSTELANKFAGRQMTVRDIYKVQAAAGTQLQLRHFKDALLRLEARGLIEATPPADKRREGTLADHVTIRFVGGGR
jgi:three-Cys-motif partner protein